MKRKTAERIVALYDAIEDSEPEISTERLLQMAADQASEAGIIPDCDVSHVADALAMLRKGGA